MPSKPQIIWKQRSCDDDYRKSLESRGLPPILSGVMARRNFPEGIKGREKSFFYPDENSLDDVSDNFRRKITEVSELIWHAILDDLKIGIIGDYDVDGIMSSVIMAKSISLTASANARINAPMVFLPSRYEEGYGLNPKTVNSYTGRWGSSKPGMTIVVDSGSSSREMIGRLKSWHNHTIVIIDHHIVNESSKSSNADLALNWRSDDGPDMCAAGLVYLVARSMMRSTGVDYSKLLPFAAMATVADKVPVDGINRAIVKIGLNRTWECGSKGLFLLGEKRMMSGAPFQNDVAFCIAPKLNSIGRTSSPYPAFELVMTGDEKKAAELASLLSSANAERKRIQSDMEKEAMDMAMSLPHNNGLLLYKDNWSPGVCGIAASGIVEVFRIPCILAGSHGGEIKGSGRSLEHINIKAIMDTIPHIFERYGGHSLACGVSLKNSFLEESSDIFDKACQQYYSIHGRPTCSSLYDMEIDPKDISNQTGRLLIKTLYPYSSETNPEPVFLIREAKISRCQIKEGETWKMMIVEASKDGSPLPMSMMTFDESLCSGLLGKTVDLYVRFRQSVDDEDTLELVGVENRMKGAS